MASSTSTRIYTKHYKQLLDPEICSFAYQHLVDNISWENGITSKREGFTRKQKALGFNDDEIVSELIVAALEKTNIFQGKPAQLGGIYLNWYQNGNDFTPMHKHDSCQLIISLGATRTLKVGNKNIASGNGDVCVFGKSLHGIPKEPNCNEGRISIALFLQEAEEEAFEIPEISDISGEELEESMMAELIRLSM